MTIENRYAKVKQRRSRRTGPWHDALRGIRKTKKKKKKKNQIRNTTMKIKIRARNWK